MPPKCNVLNEKGQKCDLDLGHDGYHENGSVNFNDKGIIVKQVNS